MVEPSFPSLSLSDLVKSLLQDLVPSSKTSTNAVVYGRADYSSFSEPSSTTCLRSLAASITKPTSSNLSYKVQQVNRYTRFLVGT
jgi:hypothetical protein